MHDRPATHRSQPSFRHRNAINAAQNNAKHPNNIPSRHTNGKS